jgi:hypothetical protein
MKWVNAAFSFLLVAVGVFFITGWCLLPAPVLDQPENSRSDRLRLLAKMDWAHNGWGFALGPLTGALSAWLTFRKGQGNSPP